MNDERLAEMADRYSTTAQNDSQREWDKLDAAKEAFIPLDFGIDPVIESKIDKMVEEEWNKKKVSKDIRIVNVITDSFGEFINSTEGRERIKQIIQNTALSGDTCW